MPSFIDLMSNDVWTEVDIKNRLHAEIRSEISEQAETELNRALQGAIMKMHTLTADEQSALMEFKTATDRVATLGSAARADWILLNKTLAHEQAASRLAQPVYAPPAIKLTKSAPTTFPEVSTQVEPTLLEIDTQERAAAQAVFDAATSDVLDLVALRYTYNNPPTPPMVAETEPIPAMLAMLAPT